MEMFRSTKNKPNTSIWIVCYSDIPNKNDKYYFIQIYDYICCWLHCYWSSLFVCSIIKCQFVIRSIIINNYLHQNQFVPLFSYVVDVKYPNVNIAIELKRILSKMTCIEEATIMRITPLISIMKLAHGNIESKGNTTYMCNQTKLYTILPNLLSICQYFHKSRTMIGVWLKRTWNSVRCLKVLI